MPEPKKIKIKKISTPIVLVGIVENDKTVERYVKAGEEVTVWDWVLPKLDALREEYELIDKPATERKPFTPVGDKS
jgi:hypothetical protein